VKRRIAYKILNDPDRYTDQKLAKARKVCGLTPAGYRVGPEIFAAVSEWLGIGSTVIPAQPAQAFSMTTFVINPKCLLLETKNASNS
jgi:hypothetical protein